VQSSVERKPATLVAYHGSRASIQFHDGQVYAIAADPLRQIGAVPGYRFVMVVTWTGKRPSAVRVEPANEARPAAPRKATPKQYLRQGERVVTRGRLMERLLKAIDQLARENLQRQGVNAVMDEWENGRPRIVVYTTGDPAKVTGVPTTVLGFPVVVRRGNAILAQARRPA
jgi:hypothetical protein